MEKRMVESIALRFAKAIKRADPERTASIEVLKFSIVAIMNSLISFIAIGTIGLLSNSFGETMIGLFSFVLLRFFSGGSHLQNAFQCSLLSVLLISIAPHIEISSDWTIYITIMNMIILGVFSPSNIEGHARIPKKYFPYLKVIAVLIASSNLLFGSTAIAFVFLFQSVSTIYFKRR
jgi:accessory gene regulator B